MKENMLFEKYGRRFKINLSDNLSARLILPTVVLILFIFSSKQISAQVTIGGAIPAQKSALLELKEYEANEDNVTSTKGFLMSRVKLVSETSLSPIISASLETEHDKNSNIGLQVYHVGGNNIDAGVKIWNGSAWSELENSLQRAGNGILNNSDTIQLGGLLTKATQITGSVSGANFEYNATAEDANMLITGNAKLGINTTQPSTMLDVNGTVSIREVPVLEDGLFNAIGIDDSGQVYKKNDNLTAYSVYLGFDPMASTHTDTIPTSLRPGFLYRMEGVAIGACEGTLVYFTIIFVGTRYVGATLQAVATREGGLKLFPPVTLTAAQPVFNIDQSLEYLAGHTACGQQYGHTLNYLEDTNQMVVTFLDEGKYFTDAGTFAITNLTQLSILGSNFSQD